MSNLYQNTLINLIEMWLATALLSMQSLNMVLAGSLIKVELASGCILIGVLLRPSVACDLLLNTVN